VFGGWAPPEVAGELTALPDTMAVFRTRRWYPRRGREGAVIKGTRQEREGTLHFC